ncbi:phosphopantetheine-binding protein [Streptomyces sp. LX-29]|uniref:acyl carrier protein n=1 Tax=Streptomyces sp. LX-29 TaxID=2900152 RepID=UPI00240D4218|nr:phosphopantetheine-binding protein [Streptomyces sp. LX-29]WFB10761.1 phosphopantetheine-binding protein [Streptomyces sp. LX-29]
MTENTAIDTAAGTAAPHSIEAIVATLEEAIAVDRPRRDLRLTDSISQDIRLDSLALLEVLTRVEEEFGIELIDTPETYTAGTVGDLAAVIQSKVAATGADTGQAV